MNNDIPTDIRNIYFCIQELLSLPPVSLSKKMVKDLGLEYLHQLEKFASYLYISNYLCFIFKFKVYRNV